MRFFNDASLYPADFVSGPWGPPGNAIVWVVPYLILFFGSYFRQLRQSLLKLLIITLIYIIIMRLAYSGNPSQEVMGAILLAAPSVFTLVCVIVAFFIYDKVVTDARLLEYSIDMMKIMCKGNPIAQVMLIGFCFSFIMEGMTSFGAAAKVITPVLVSLGFSPYHSIVFIQLSQAVPVTFGATGLPLSIGVLSANKGILTNQDAVRTGFVVACQLFICTTILFPFYLKHLFTWNEIRKNSIFIILSYLSVMIPLVGSSYIGYQFVAITAGFVGCISTGLLAYYQIGLSKDNSHPHSADTFRRRHVHRNMRHYIQKELRTKDKQIINEVLDRMLLQAQDYKDDEVRQSYQFDPLTHSASINQLHKLDPHAILAQIQKEKNNRLQEETNNYEQTLSMTQKQDKDQAKASLLELQKQIEKRLNELSYQVHDPSQEGYDDFDAERSQSKSLDQKPIQQTGPSEQEGESKLPTNSKHNPLFKDVNDASIQDDEKPQNGQERRTNTANQNLPWREKFGEGVRSRSSLYFKDKNESLERKNKTKQREIQEIPAINSSALQQHLEKEALDNNLVDRLEPHPSSRRFIDTDVKDYKTMQSLNNNLEDQTMFSKKMKQFVRNESLQGESKRYISNRNLQDAHYDDYIEQTTQRRIKDPNLDSIKIAQQDHSNSSKGQNNKQISGKIGHNDTNLYKKQQQDVAYGSGKANAAFKNPKPRKLLDKKSQLYLWALQKGPYATWFYEVGYFFHQTTYSWYIILIMMITTLIPQVAMNFQTSTPYFQIGLKSLMDIQWSSHLVVTFNNIGGLQGNFVYVFAMLSLPFVFPYLSGIIIIEALNYKMFKWPQQLYTPLIYVWQLFKAISPILFCNLFTSRQMYAGTSTPSQMLGYTIGLSMQKGSLVWLFIIGFMSAFAIGNVITTSLINSQLVTSISMVSGLCTYQAFGVLLTAQASGTIMSLNNLNMVKMAIGAQFLNEYELFKVFWPYIIAQLIIHVGIGYAFTFTKVCDNPHLAYSNTG